MSVPRVAFLFVCLLAGAASPVGAQQNHERHHADYKNWSSQKTANCCDNRDCGTISDDDVRETATGTQIKISGQWCPVERRHYLIKGRSPDWNVRHACIRPQSVPEDICDRLLCFTDRGGV